MKRECWMNRVLLACSLVVLVSDTASFAAEPGPESPVVLPGAKQFDLESAKGQKYRIYLSLPEGEIPAAGRPVIYLSDANGSFPILATLARRRSRTGAGSVVVGIGYPTEDRQIQTERRAYDLTPRASDEWLKKQPVPVQNQKTGGNDEFLDFIEKEVKPLIESRVKIDRSHQMLFGHSFGGLLVLHALFTRPDSYQYYAASSPSIWFNDRSILKEEEAFIKKHTGKELPVHLWVTVGELEQRSPGGKAVGPAISQDLRQAANGRELIDRLSKASIQGFEATYTDLPGEDHGSAVFPASNRAIRQFFPVR